MTSIYDRELRRTGIQTTQFTLLAAIAGRPGANQRQLSDWLAMDQSTLSRNLKALAKNGWIVSRTPPGARAGRYEATLAGGLALKRARPGWQRAQALVKGVLGPDWSTMGRLLRKLSTMQADSSSIER